jgi:hypothetical protein
MYCNRMLHTLKHIVYDMLHKHHETNLQLCKEHSHILCGIDLYMKLKFEKLLTKNIIRGRKSVLDCGTQPAYS